MVTLTPHTQQRVTTEDKDFIHSLTEFFMEKEYTGTYAFKDPKPTDYGIRQRCEFVFTVPSHEEWERKISREMQTFFETKKYSITPIKGTVFMCTCKKRKLLAMIKIKATNYSDPKTTIGIKFFGS